MSADILTDPRPRLETSKQLEVKRDDALARATAQAQSIGDLDNQAEAVFQELAMLVTVIGDQLKDFRSRGQLYGVTPGLMNQLVVALGESKTELTSIARKADIVKRNAALACR